MNESQIILVGFVASALTLFLKVLASYSKVSLSRAAINIVLYVVSVVLAATWAGATLPVFPQWAGDAPAFASALWQWLNAWIALGAPVLGSATLIYNLLYAKVVLPLKAKFLKT